MDEVSLFNFEVASLGDNAFASSSTWLARTDDVEDSLHFPFAKLITLSRRIKIALPFGVCSRFPLMNSAVHEMFFCKLNFPVDIFVDLPPSSSDQVFFSSHRLRFSQ